MKLYLLRHAIAEERSKKYEDDSLRPLTAEGKKLMRRNAKGMKALNITFDTLVSSPYTRAAQTAQIVNEVYKRTRKTVLSVNLTPDAPFSLLVKEINALFPKARAVMIVGHEPHLSNFMVFLLGGQCSVPVELKKGGLACLSFRGSLMAKNATLNWLLPPDVLRRIKGSAG